MPKKKASAKPLDKKALKKTKGGLLPAMGDGSVRSVRPSTTQADPPEPEINLKPGTFTGAS